MDIRKEAVRGYLVEGTDIKYIKDLLGHFDIRTTERYLHVSKQQLINIVSPFDELWNDKKLDWRGYLKNI